MGDKQFMAQIVVAYFVHLESDFPNFLLLHNPIIQVCMSTAPHRCYCRLSELGPRISNTQWVRNTKWGRKELVKPGLYSHRHRVRFDCFKGEHSSSS